MRADHLGFPLVGTRIDVYWDDREVVYSGVVTMRKGLNIRMNYDDGEHHRHNLNKIQWRLEGHKTWIEPGDANELIQDDKDNSFVVSIDERKVESKVTKKPSKRKSKKDKRKHEKIFLTLPISNEYLSQFSTTSVSSPTSSTSTTHDDYNYSSLFNSPASTPKKRRKRQHHGRHCEASSSASTVSITSFLGENIEVDDEEQMGVKPPEAKLPGGTEFKLQQKEVKTQKSNELKSEHKVKHSSSITSKIKSASKASANLNSKRPTPRIEAKFELKETAIQQSKAIPQAPSQQNEKKPSSICQADIDMLLALCSAKDTACNTTSKALPPVTVSEQCPKKPACGIENTQSKRELISVRNLLN